MSSAVMTPPQFLAGFDEAAFDACASGEAPFICARREKAFNHDRLIPHPTNRDEEYRRTDPILFRLGRYTRIHTVGTGRLQKTRPRDEALQVVGTFTEQRSGPYKHLPLPMKR